MRNAMMPSRSASGFVLLLLVLLASLGPAGSAWTQKPPPPVKPNPQAPVLTMPAPLGLQRGTALELTLTGSNLAGPTGLLTGFPCKVSIPNDNKNGTDNAKLRVRLEVPADAAVGFHRFQLATRRGLSNLRLFCVDDLPQVQHVPGKHSRAAAQPVPVPSVAVGRLDSEASDFYRITVKAGQSLSFDVLGHRLGGPIDPQLFLYDGTGRHELAHANDSPGAQTDPRLRFTFKEAGAYLLEISDVLNRGGADYWYRLRIGDFPLATEPIPMAVRRGSKTTVHFAGPAVAGVAPIEVTAPTDAGVTTLWVAPKGPTGLHGWPVALAVTDQPEQVEQEPNNEPAKANPLPVPGGVTGRFEQPNDSDLYRITAKKGQRLRIQVETLTLYSPTLVYLMVRDAKGKELAKSNPQAPPPVDQRIDFTAPAEGVYLIEVQHLNYVGGPDEAYHLSVAPLRPDFDLALGLDRFDVAPGGVTPLIVSATRRGYAGPIELSVVGPPGFKGEIVLAAGQPFTTLYLQAGPDLNPGPYLLQVRGKAVIEGGTVTELVNVQKAVSDSLAGLTYPPRQLDTQIALAVKEKAPFQLSVHIEPHTTAPGLPVNLVVRAVREPGFAEEIALGPAEGLPPNVKPPALKPIPKGQSEIKVPLDLNAKAPLGKYHITLMGRAKYQKQDYRVYAQPATVTIAPPFELTLTPAELRLSPGGKGKLKVTAARNRYEGPITLQLRNLPAKVMAAKADIPQGKAEVEIDLTAAPDAPAARRADVNILGTAPALGNQQRASPNFAISVAKKK
jgi:hypothetical protein